MIACTLIPTDPAVHGVFLTRQASPDRFALASAAGRRLGDRSRVSSLSEDV